MGPEIYQKADMAHPELGRLAWGLWEYPMGIENMHETDVGEHDLLEDISYGLRHEPDYDEPPEEGPDLAVMLERLPAQLTTLDAALASLTRQAGTDWAQRAASRIQAGA